MRVLTALTYYAPHWTGLTVFARTIAEGLAARGHDVTVLTSRFDDSLDPEERIGGVRVVRVPIVARLSRTVVMPSFPALANRLLAEHDVVHVHTPMPEAALLVRLARLRGAASVVTHQGDVVMPAGGVLNRLVQAAMTTTLSSAFRRADAVTTHSADYAGHSRQLAARPAPVVAITPPVSIPQPDAGGVAARRDELGLVGRPVVGFAGRFVEEKGFDFLLRAIPAIRAAVPAVAFAFAGETSVAYERFYERCRPLLDANADAIAVLGLLRDRQRLADFYAMCDVFALPSRSDCFPAVQVEAMLCGTPVVCADIPGAREVVLSTGYGRLVPPGDPVPLAEGIVAELANPRSARSRAELAAWFDFDKAIDRYEAVLLDAVQDTVQRRKPSPPRAVSVRPLDAADRATVERLLGNEADMAFRRRVPRLIELLDLSDGHHLLDCGCGMGVLSMIVAAVRDVSIVGVDGDRQRLEWAVREAVAAQFAEVDIAALPFPEAAFDRVLLAEVLEHLDDDVAGLTEIARVLKPGGAMAISVPHARYPKAWDPLNNALELFGLPPRTRQGGFTGQWSGHTRLYLPQQLATVIERAGLAVESIEEQTAYTVPFHHALVYGVGKPLIERDLLPASLRDAADRFRAERNSGSRLNPVNLAVAALRLYDRRNDRLRGDETRFVQLVARATKR